MVNKIFIILFGLLLIAAAIFILIPKETTENKSYKPVEYEKNLTLEVGGTQIQVETARTPAELSKGLSGRDFLSPQNGMLFYLVERNIETFWMKDMKFPLDIIWIDNGEIVYVVENASIPTSDNIPRFTPDKPATHVLEVNAGFVEKNGIKLGDFIKIPDERQL